MPANDGHPEPYRYEIPVTGTIIVAAGGLDSAEHVRGEIAAAVDAELDDLPAQVVSSVIQLGHSRHRNDLDGALRARDDG